MPARRGRARPGNGPGLGRGGHFGLGDRDEAPHVRGCRFPGLGELPGLFGPHRRGSLRVRPRPVVRTLAAELLKLGVRDGHPLREPFGRREPTGNPDIATVQDFRKRRTPMDPHRRPERSQRRWKRAGFVAIFAATVLALVVSSLPAFASGICVRSADPAGEADLVTEGAGSTLQYYWATPRGVWKHAVVAGDGTTYSG
jgi:hypothetical protein